MRSEMLILRKSRWFLSAVVILPAIATFLVMKSAQSFFQSEHFASDMPVYLAQTCSQIVFPILFASASFGTFFFALKGFFDINTERTRGILQLKLVNNNARTICVRRIASVSVLSVLVSFASIALGVIAQSISNLVWPDYSRRLFLKSGALKIYVFFVASVVLLDVTIYAAGMIIGIVIRNRIIGAAVAIAFLLVVVNKSYLVRGTFCLYSGEAEFFVSDPKTPIPGITEGVMWLLEVITCICGCILASVLLAEKRIGHES